MGRPRLTQELRDVVTRIGSENLLWGYKRIAGELKKLGLHADANSVKHILNDAGKRECLNFVVCFSRSQSDQILGTWVHHYNTERPHRGRDIGNNVLQVDFRPVRDGPIRRNRKPGGIVTSYTREVAWVPWPSETSPKDGQYRFHLVGFHHSLCRFTVTIDQALHVFWHPSQGRPKTLGEAQGRGWWTFRAEAIRLDHLIAPIWPSRRAAARYSPEIMARGRNGVAVWYSGP
ncbi:transposase [Ruegeria aquimaris]|uniref:Transposase n=1 Tax=Ruegeria aquimaris TaxID=2984333 RepID=A0ABT3AQP4_9RHOB|nr:transposase [Ruegeria sp. XHP0148]MCV2890998.1 transposase [Ruegeria sp. XHP0148]